MKVLILFLFTTLMVACKPNTDLYEWRGPNRTGVYQENNLLKTWPEDGPELIWYFNELGNGYGSPIITEDRVYIVGTIDSTALLFCFDLEGQLQYNKAFGKEWVLNFPGSRCAPTVMKDKVYAMTGHGDVVCLKTQTGETIWKRNMLEDFGGVAPRFGYAESLVVCNDKIICVPGGKDHNVVALNRNTGELLWSCAGKGECPGYNPGKLIRHETRKIYVTFSAYHLLGIDAKNGELLWTHEQVNTKPEDRKPGLGDTHSNALLYENNHVYYFAGDGNCATALKLNETGSEIKQVWNNAQNDNFMGGIVMMNDRIYSGGFSSHDLNIIHSKSGKILNSLHIGSGALIAADKMLYYYNQQGEVHLVDYQNDELKSVSSFEITKGSKQHFAHPVIKNGVLYVRHGEYLAAYSISD